MSWDLVFWFGDPAEDPPLVWNALSDDESVDGLKPLDEGELRKALVIEFGDRIVVTSNENGVNFVGDGWEGLLEPGSLTLELSCEWSFQEDVDKLTSLVRAGLRTGCTVFEPQTEGWWEASEDDLDDFDVEDDMIHID